MTIRRYLLRLSFWSAVLLAILGIIITFVPGAECGWFLLVAALSVAGFFISKTCYRIAAAMLLVFALKAAYDGYQGGIRFRERPFQAQQRKAPFDSYRTGIGDRPINTREGRLVIDSSSTISL